MKFRKQFPIGLAVLAAAVIGSHAADAQYRSGQYPAGTTSYGGSPNTLYTSWSPYGSVYYGYGYGYGYGSASASASSSASASASSSGAGSSSAASSAASAASSSSSGGSGYWLVSSGWKGGYEKPKDGRGSWKDDESWKGGDKDKKDGWGNDYGKDDSEKGSGGYGKGGGKKDDYGYGKGDKEEESWYDDEDKESGKEKKYDGGYAKGGESGVYNAELTGQGETPSTPSKATGEFEIRFQDAGSAVFFLGVWEGRDVTAAHLHCGKLGENGPVIVTLAGETPEGIDVDDLWLSNRTLDDRNVQPTACGSTLADLRRAVGEGKVYVNVHTVPYPNGEIRGQLETEWDRSAK